MKYPGRNLKIFVLDTLKCLYIPKKEIRMKSMKIKKADIIMISIIFATVISGLFFALKFSKDQMQTEWGRTFVAPKQISGEEENICTLEIRCNTIFDHVENLNPTKIPFVPENGVILEKTEIAFKEGETVFDVLCRICKDAKIQLEYSWTPIYDSYYVEGINQIYEFDCGGQSGWMYQVNGEFPNYGCSGFKVSSDDEITWIYTCEGLGTDVGAKMGE